MPAPPSPPPRSSNRRSRSRSPPTRRRSRSPPRRSEHRDDGGRGGSSRSGGGGGNGGGRDRDRKDRDDRDSYRGGGGRDRGVRSDRDGGRDRDEGRRSSRPRGEEGGRGGGGRDQRDVPPPSSGPPGGDGGWGVRSRPPQSPGRPSQSLALPSQSALAGGEGGGGGDDKPPPVKPIEPNFAPSGALAAETNTFQGVVLKYNEPPEARKPVRNWRLYVFKGKEQLELFHVHRQSAYLFGRDRIVADIPVDHPSTSKQHAVLQFRQVHERNEFGDTKTLTKPFIIDLESANGTMVNEELVPPSRYYELKSNDVLKFAFSTREYVLLAET